MSHCWPPLQALPHLPQLSRLVRVSTQRSPHCVCPAAQAPLPMSQIWPPVQAMPQPPQCCASVCVSTQVCAPVPAAIMLSTTLTVTEPHSCPPFGQAHAPDSQVCVSTHAWPHAPQFCSSLCV